MTATNLNTVLINPTIYIDAGLAGWGRGVFGKSKTGGSWTKQEQGLHTNVLEISRAELRLLSFSRNNAGIKQITSTSSLMHSRNPNQILQVHYLHNFNNLEGKNALDTY